MKHLPKFFYVVDIGFILYWFITGFHLIPDEYLYNDYKNELLVYWNWSFFPLDIAVSATGIYSLYLRKKGSISWTIYALLSLILTSTSGLMAISFWIFKGDYDLSWWAPNLFLLFYPVYFIREIIKSLAKG